MLDFTSYYFNIHAMPVFSAAFIVLAGGAYIRFKNQFSKTTLAFLLFSISLCIWFFATAMGYMSNKELIAAVWFRFDNFGVMFISVSVYFFTKAVLEIESYIDVYLGYFVAFFLGVLAIGTNWLVCGVKKYYWGFFPVWSYLSVPVFLLFFGYMLASFLLLFKALQGKKLDSVKRNHVKYLIVGYLIGYTGSVDFLPTLGIDIYPFGFISILLYFSIVFYVVSQYKLMDIRLAVGKVVIFLGIYAVAVIAPFLLYYFVRNPLFAWGVFAVLCAVAPYVIAALEDKFRHIIYKEEFARRRLLRLTSQTAAKMDRMDELADWATKSLCDLLNVSQAYLFIHDAAKEKYISYSGYPSTVPIGLIGFPELSSIIEASKEGFMVFNKKKEDEDRLHNMFSRDDIYKLRQMNKQINEVLIEDLDEINDNMSQLGAELVFMIRFEEYLEGLLFLGPKREQHIYISEDIETLMDFCDGIAAAIKHIRAYEELHETQARLVQEEKWATLGRLGTSTKHELGSPVAIINLSLDMLFYKMRNEENSNKPIKEYRQELQDIKAQALRSMNTLDIIHQLPKQVQEGMVGLKLDDILDKSFELSRFQTYWENLSDTPVEREYSADLPLIKGNMVHLQGVFLNLIINSYQAMEGMEHIHRKITIKAKRDELRSNMIEIRFSDTGIGIPARNLKTIFDFKYTTKKRGSGLGLFVSKYYIEKIHEGTIEAVNNEGGGACFIICLPVWRDSEDDTSSAGR